MVKDNRVVNRIEKINSLGTVKEILHSREKLMKLLTDEDIYLIDMFYTMVSEEMDSLYNEDLLLLRNGFIQKCTINLEELLELKGRKPLWNEVAKKYSSLAKIDDVLVEQVSFTRMEVIQSFAGLSYKELNLLETVFDDLNIDTQKMIAERVELAGNTTKTIKLLERIKKNEEILNKTNMDVTNFEFINYPLVRKRMK